MQHISQGVITYGSDLNMEQRKFLEWIHDEHNCIGYGTAIETILKQGYYVYNNFSAEYDFYKPDNIYVILEGWKEYLKDGDWISYGKPKKYLNFVK